MSPFHANAILRFVISRCDFLPYGNTPFQGRRFCTFLLAFHSPLLRCSSLPAPRLRGIVISAAMRPRDRGPNQAARHLLPLLLSKISPRHLLRVQKKVCVWGCIISFRIPPPTRPYYGILQLSGGRLIGFSSRTASAPGASAVRRASKQCPQSGARTPPTESVPSRATSTSSSPATSRTTRRRSSRTPGIRPRAWAHTPHPPL